MAYILVFYMQVQFLFGYYYRQEIKREGKFLSPEKKLLEIVWDV